jgi:hypothetical protein
MAKWSKYILPFLSVSLLVFIVFTLITFFSFKRYEAPKKIIWTYWNEETIPPIVEKILKHRASVLTSWKQIILSDKTYTEYVDLPSDILNTLKPQHKADWLRLELLKKYGGCWMDASIIVNSEEELNAIYNQCCIKQMEFTGFYTPRHIIRNDPSTFIENWCMIAPRHSRIITTWLDEYLYACRLGFLNYKREVLRKYTVSRDIYNPDDDDVYITAYAAFQVALQETLKKQVNILLFNSFDYMYKIHWECFDESVDDYDHDCIVLRLRDDPSVKQMPFIKISGHTRKFLDKVDISSYFDRP